MWMELSWVAGGVIALTAIEYVLIRLRRAQLTVNRMQMAMDEFMAILHQPPKDTPLRLRNPHVRPCFETAGCKRQECAARGEGGLRCWLLASQRTPGQEANDFMERLHNCESCKVFRQAQPDAAWAFVEQLNAVLALLENDARQIAELERRAERAGRLAALGEFAGGLAHEINNPLDGLMNCLMRLQRDPANLSQNMEYLSLMREALQRISSTVQHILEFSRKREARLEPCDMHAVLQDVAGLVKVSARYGATELRLEYEEPIPLVLGDRSYLNEVFLNLALNAIAAMVPGGTLTFRMQVCDAGAEAGRFLEVNVIDTGQGIDPADLPHVFEPFFSTKEPGKGTGLGLTVVKQIVEEHYGKIRIDSEPGKGVTVTIWLPIVEEPPLLPLARPVQGSASSEDSHSG